MRDKIGVDTNDAAFYTQHLSIITKSYPIVNQKILSDLFTVKLLLDNNLCGTLFGTLAAAGAKALIDMCNVVGQRNRAGRTVLLADAAADTAGVAHVTNLFALFLREAADNIMRVVRYQFNQVVRADADALAAGTAVFFADDCAAVDNLNCVKRTCLCTGTFAQTAIRAGFGAASGCKRNLIAGNCALIVIDKLGLVAGTGAFYKRNLPDKIFYRQTHRFRNLARGFRSADRTGRGLCLPFCNPLPGDSKTTVLGGKYHETSLQNYCAAQRVL